MNFDYFIRRRIAIPLAGEVEQFKTAHPKSGVDACDGGGRWISYDLARLSESGEYTDGGVGPYSGYYTSLLVTPDKLHNVSDFDHTYYNPSSDRVHLALNPTWYRDPGDGENLDSIRKDWEIYHYLIAKGVAGRGSHVFRPRVTGDAASRDSWGRGLKFSPNAGAV